MFIFFIQFVNFTRMYMTYLSIAKSDYGCIFKLFFRYPLIF